MQETIFWVNPEDQLPDEDKPIIWVDKMWNYIYAGEFRFNHFDADYPCHDINAVLKWAYVTVDNFKQYN